MVKIIIWLVQFVFQKTVIESGIIQIKQTYYEKNVGRRIRKLFKQDIDEALYAYNVYQIEGEGKNLFSNIEGDENTLWVCQ